MIPIPRHDNSHRDTRKATNTRLIDQNAGYAMSFNGSDEYLTLALPTDIASFTPSTISPATNGNPPTGWSKQSTCTIDYVTTESGSSGCMKILFSSNGGIKRTGILTVGKKYKVSFRYKANYFFRIGSLTAVYKQPEATSEWNTITFVFTATSADLYIRGEGAYLAWIESISIKEDQGFDLNKDQEQILHSKNWDFERTLGTDLIGTLNFNSGWAGSNTTFPSNTSFTNSVNGYGPYRALLTVGQKYVLNIAGSTTDASGLKVVNASGGTTPLILDLPTGAFSKEIEFLAVDTNLYLRNTSTGTTTITSFAVKPIPNLVTNGTFDSASDWAVYQCTSYYDAVNKWVEFTSSTNGMCGINKSFGVSGKRYKFTFYAKLVSGTNSSPCKRVGNVDITASDIISNPNINGTFQKYEFIYTANDTILRVYWQCSIGDVIAIDNIHIYEIPEWTASGNHTSDISTLDKSGTTGTQSLKVTASGAGRGAELVTNPNISGSATGWTITVPAVVAYGNDNLVCTNLNNSSTVKPTGVTCTAGKIYEVIFTVTVTSGNIAMVAGVGATGRTNKTVSGTYRELQTCVNTGDFYVDGTNFYGTIESLSVKEYLGEVSLPSANLESCVATKKYTLEGEARLDPASLSYTNNATLSNNFDSSAGSWSGQRTSIVVTSGELVCTINNVNSPIGILATNALMSNKVYRVRFKAKISSVSTTTNFNYVGKLIGSFLTISNPYLSNTYQNYEFYTTTTTTETFYLGVLASGLNLSDIIYLDDIIIDEATPITLTAQLGTKSVTSSALSIVAGTFTKFVLNFEATASEVNQGLKLWLSGAGSVYVDKLSLTQKYDYAIIGKAKVNDLISHQYIIGFSPWGTFMLYKPANTTDLVVYNISRYNVDLAVNAGNISNALSGKSGVWFDYKIVDIHNDSRLYVDNLQGGVDLSTKKGKMIFADALYISSNTDSFALDGAIGKTQIIRFDNISQSNFDPTTFKVGQSVSGGGSETVLLLNFGKDKTSMTSILKDWSSTGNSPTGVNVDQTNIVRKV